MKRLVLALSIVIAGMGFSPLAEAQNAYSIPDELTPVSEWADGFTFEQATKFRNAWTAADFSLGNDISAFVYLNASEVLPAMVIKRGGPVANLESAPMPEIADVVSTTKLGTMPLSAAIADKRSRMQAILVMHKGRIVFEQYPGMPPDMNHVWNSASKIITGLLTHLLAREGRFDIKRPLSDYLDYTSGTPAGRVLIEDYLHQRSGLNIEETQPNIQNPDHPLGKWFHGSLAGRGEPTGATTAETLVTLKADREPNTAFEYSTFNTQIVGEAIQVATGTPLNRLISEYIWSKAGMEGDCLLSLSSAGDPLNGGGFSSLLRDFGRYALLFTPSWNAVASEKVVPDDYLDTVYAAMNKDIYRVGHQGPRMVADFGEDDAPIGTSYQWDAIFADGDLYKAGLGGQAIYVSPETDTAIVYFSTTWQNSLSMISYARAIVKQKFRSH